MIIENERQRRGIATALNLAGDMLCEDAEGNILPARDIDPENSERADECWDLAEKVETGELPMTLTGNLPAVVREALATSATRWPAGPGYPEARLDYAAAVALTVTCTCGAATESGMAVIVVTPAMARDWYETAWPSRKLNKTGVDYLASQITGGTWNLAAAVLTFAEGRLLNGRRILAAIILTEETVPCTIRTTDVPAVPVIDTGRETTTSGWQVELIPATEENGDLSPEFLRALLGES